MTLLPISPSAAEISGGKGPEVWGIDFDLALHHMTDFKRCWTRFSEDNVVFSEEKSRGPIFDLPKSVLGPSGREPLVDGL